MCPSEKKEFPFDSGVGYESGVGQSGRYLMMDEYYVMGTRRSPA